MPVSKLFQTVNTQIKDYEKVRVKTNPVFAPNQKDIIELVDYYWANKYRDGDNDSTGFKKAFYNVILNPTEVAQKMLDVDTKDIKIIAEEGQSYYPAWFFGKSLKIWMKDAKNLYGRTFGQFLNETVYKYPKYGTILAKKAKGTVHLVPLQNIKNRPDARSILDSDLIIEEHNMTPYQLRQQGWDRDKVEKIITAHLKDGMIKILEVCGSVNGYQDDYFIMPDNGNEGEILFSDKKDRKDVYKELKFDDIPGRAIGRGMVERLFETQIAQNQQEHWLRSGQRWSSKHIFQTKDDTMISKNLIRQVENGDILTILSEILPISVEERNLPAYNFLGNKWDRQAQELSFAFNQVKGERPPAGTPLGTSVLQTNMSVQYYDLKREDLGMFLKDILYEWIIPEFKKNKKGTHGIMMGEFEPEELDKLRNLLLVNRGNKAILRYVAKNMRLPSTMEAEVLRGIEKERISTMKEIGIPYGYYDDLKYKIDVVITNEQIDVSARLTTLQTILQIIGTNPTIMRDPRTRNIFYKLIDLSGFSPVDFGLDEPTGLEDVMGQGVQMGGSPPRPQVSNQPQSASVQTTL